jgi:hypothetical protein
MRGEGRSSQQWNSRPNAKSAGDSDYRGRRGGRWRRARGGQGQPWTPANTKREFVTVKREPKPALPANFRRFMRKKFPAITAEFYDMMSENPQPTNVIDLTSGGEEGATGTQTSSIIEIKPNVEDMDVAAGQEEIAKSRHKSTATKANEDPEKRAAPVSHAEYQQIEARCRTLEQSQLALQQQLDVLRQKFATFEASTNNFIDAANAMAADVEDLDLGI